MVFSSSVIGLKLESDWSFSPRYTERRAKKKKKKVIMLKFELYFFPHFNEDFLITQATA